MSAVYFTLLCVVTDDVGSVLHITVLFCVVSDDISSVLHITLCCVLLQMMSTVCFTLLCDVMCCYR